MTTAPFQTLVELYQRSVREFASNPLFGQKRDGHWHWMTYAEFGELVDRIRGGLAALGIASGDRVAIISDNRPEWAATAYATYGLGGASVPMYLAQPIGDWVYILKDCNAKAVVVADAATRDALNTRRADLPELKHIIVMDEPGDSQSVGWAELLSKGDAPPVVDDGKGGPLQVKPQDLAGFIYTSGTTGNPKGVLLSHGNFASNVAAIHERFDITPDDRSLCFLPWAHSFGQSVELHGLLSHGASIAIAESREKIVANLAEIRPTVLLAVPQIFNRIYDGVRLRMAETGGIKKRLFDLALANEKRRRELGDRVDRRVLHAILDRLVFSKVRARFGGRMRFAVCGGAALSPEVARFIDDFGLIVYEGYGLTETSPVSAANSPGRRRVGSVGHAFPDVRVVVDQQALDQPDDSGHGQGELVVYGPNVMQGYHNLPEENAKVFTADGGLRTGDMGYIDKDGFVFITGRIKEQYKLLNGKYVVPSPLEEQIKLSSYIANIMVHGANKPFNVALVVPAFDALRSWAKQRGVDPDPARLIDDENLKSLLVEEIAKYSSDFRGFERVKRITLTQEDFTTENGMLTPSMKIKRREVIKRYEPAIEALYS